VPPRPSWRKTESEVNVSQEKPHAPVCWFCGLRPPDKDSASKWDMYKEIKIPAAEFTSMAHNSWQTANVPVPRCAECKRAHDRREGYVERGWKIGLPLGVVVAVALYLSGLMFLPTLLRIIVRPTLGLVFIPAITLSFAVGGGIVGWLMGRSAIPQGMKDQSAATLHPNIKGMERDGWKIGSKPVRP
jgi:hypothetical protein